MGANPIFHLFWLVPIYPDCEKNQSSENGKYGAMIFNVPKYN